eukprot:1141507-Pelagomonas_calceolata.AAC.9
MDSIVQRSFTGTFGLWGNDRDHHACHQQYKAVRAAAMKITSSIKSSAADTRCPLFLSLFLFLSLSHAHTHTHTHQRQHVQEGWHQGVAIPFPLAHQGFHLHDQLRTPPQEHVLFMVAYVPVVLPHHHYQHGQQYDLHTDTAGQHTGRQHSFTDGEQLLV